MSEAKKTCDICKKTTGTGPVHTVDYGDWLSKGGLEVHYFCLLLSYHLPQHGKDGSGILGFLLNDIRREINEAAKRICHYCSEPHASLRCATCGVYYHLTCSETRKCLWIFTGTFPTYCDACVPWTEEQKRRRKAEWLPSERCYICKEVMTYYDPASCVYAPCCGNGYVHMTCMRKYALSAGYYLKCIWCKAISFRESIRRMGVYVPDREARWESLNNTYSNFHRRHNRCDIVECLCPRGRDYSTGKWMISLCSLCGSFGAHNPICLIKNLHAKKQLESFKCPTCISVDFSFTKKTSRENSTVIDTSNHLHESHNEPSQIIIQNQDNNIANTQIHTVTSTAIENTDGTWILQGGNDDSSSTLTPEYLIFNGRIQTNPNANVGDTNPVHSVIDLCSQSTIDTVATTSNITCKEQMTIAVPDTVTTVLKPDNNLSMSMKENWMNFKCIVLNAKGKPIGVDQMRIDLNENRFKGLTLSNIMENAMHLLNDDDIQSSSDDLSLINAIQQIIDDIAGEEIRNESETHSETVKK